MTEPTIASTAKAIQDSAAAAAEAKRLELKTAKLRQLVNLRADLDKNIASIKEQRLNLKRRKIDLQAVAETLDELQDADLDIETLSGMIGDVRRVINGETLETVLGANLCCETPAIFIMESGDLRIAEQPLGFNRLKSFLEPRVPD